MVSSCNQPIDPGSSAPNSDDALGPHTVLQSRHWEDFQRALGRSTHRFGGDGWSALVVETPSAAGRHWYVPYGPVTDAADRLDSAVSTLLDAARGERIGWLRMEPTIGAARASEADPQRPGTPQDIPAQVRRRRVVESPRDIQPRRSRWIDTRMHEDDILAGMTGTNRTL